MRKIVLLVCDQFPGILTSDIPSYESMFQKVFRAVDENCPFDVYQTWHEQLPEFLNDEDLYVITGSNSSAYDNTLWVTLLKDWIRRAYTVGCNLVGVCFGHQVIAEALGGMVERSNRGWGIGIRTSHIVDDDFRRIAGADSFSLLYNHHDQVIRLPKDASVVSHSMFCPLESYRIGSQVLCFQGHPEFTKAFVSHWVTHCAPNESVSVRQHAEASIEDGENQGVEVTRWILRFFNWI